jgi:cardiolipin synthase
VKLLVQPDSGVAPLIAAITRAKKSVEIAIFRFDIRELEKAIDAAVSRGVVVHALIAQTNQGGAELLRQLEMRLLEAGVTVSRTADDLVRYHGKYLIIDRASLWVLGFNSTHLDMFKSRSFGLVTTSRALVHEAATLFDADTTRQPYESASTELVISPANARARLTALIASARRQLLIYDPRISDAPMLRLCQERAKAGVDVRILGAVSGRGAGLRVEKLQDLRLHVRAIVRDGIETFIGSQSLRGVELDRRREVGIVVRNRRIARQVQAVFEADWARRVEMSAKDARLSRDEAADQPSPA